MILGDERLPHTRTPWRRVVNGYGGIIPPHAVVRVISSSLGSDGEYRYTVDQPNSSSGAHFVNGPLEISAAGEGWATNLAAPGVVQYDSSSGSPAVGQTWGPQSGSWQLKFGTTGVISLGGAATASGYAVMTGMGTTGTGTTIIGFELTATLALSGSAAAVTVENDIATANVVTVYDPYDPEGMWTGIAGYRGLAVLYPTDSTKADIIEMEQIAAWIEFTTTEAMGYATAGQVAATVTFYDHQGKNPGTPVNVRDPQGIFADVPTGAKGSADYDYHNGYYRIRRCQRIALFADALLNGNNCGSSGPSVDNFTIIPQGEYALPPAVAPATCTNSLTTHGGIDNDPVLLMRTNAAGTLWRLVDVLRHATTVISSIRVKSGGLILEGETVSILAERCAAPAYTDLITLTESTFVTNIPTDSDSINQTKRKVRAFGDNATDVTTDVIGLDPECPNP